MPLTHPSALAAPPLYRMDVFRETSYLAGKAGQASQLLDKVDTTTFTAVVEETGGAETDAQTRLVRATLERENRKLGGVRVNPMTGAQEKMLWFNDFATSAYRDFPTKMMGVRAKRVDRQSDRRLVFHFDSFEPFDGYDISKSRWKQSFRGIGSTKCSCGISEAGFCNMTFRSRQPTQGISTT